MKGMKVKAIVERGKDGLYAVYSDAHIGNSYFGGFGDSVALAKADFMESIEEALKEEESDMDKGSIQVEYHYDIPSFFNFFDFFNVSKFAEYAGINESKMRAYKSGASYPGEKTTAKIFQAVKKLCLELNSVSMLLAALLLTLAAVGCHDPNEEPVDDGTVAKKRVLSAQVEALAPPELVEILWRATDTLAVYPDGQSQPVKFNIQRGLGTGSAEFVGTVAGKTLIALCPYSAGTDDGLKGKELNLKLPAVQQYTKGGVDKRGLPAVAVSQTDELSFKQLCGVLQLSITGNATLSSIRLTAKNPNMKISGKAKVRTDYAQTPFLTMQGDASNELTLQCKGGVALKEDEATIFYVALPPGAYGAGGFSLEIITFSGTVNYEMGADVAIERATITPVPAFACNPGGTASEDNVPYNQIWYKTSDDNPLALEAGRFQLGLVSNTFDAEDGWCKAVFDGPVTPPEEEPVTKPTSKEVEKDSPTEEPVEEPAVTMTVPEPQPRNEIVTRPNRGRSRVSDSRISVASPRRERISNSQDDKKLVKIVFFYEDRSFEEYYPR